MQHWAGHMAGTLAARIRKLGATSSAAPDGLSACPHKSAPTSPCSHSPGDGEKQKNKRPCQARGAVTDPDRCPQELRAICDIARARLVRSSSSFRALPRRHPGGCARRFRDLSRTINVPKDWRCFLKAQISPAYSREGRALIAEGQPRFSCIPSTAGRSIEQPVHPRRTRNWQPAYPAGVET